LAPRLSAAAAAVDAAAAAAVAAVAAAVAAVAAAVAARTLLYRQLRPDARFSCRCYNLAWAALFAGRSTDTSLMADRHFAVAQTLPVPVADARTAAAQQSSSCRGMWDRRRVLAVGKPTRSIA